MKTKEEIVQNWLPRYTGEKLENFGKYILLTNFSNYVYFFSEWHQVEVVGRDNVTPLQRAEQRVNRLERHSPERYEVRSARRYGKLIAHRRFKIASAQ